MTNDQNCRIMGILGGYIRNGRDSGGNRIRGLGKSGWKAMKVLVKKKWISGASLNLGAIGVLLTITCINVNM